MDTPTTTTDSASPESGVREAWAPKNIIWPQGKSVLQVKFLNVIPTTWKYKGGGLNFGNIEQWANIWSTSVQGGGIIPQFQFAAGGNAPSDIRVKFVGKFIIIHTNCVSVRRKFAFLCYQEVQNHQDLF